MMKYQSALRPLTPVLLGVAALLASCTATPPASPPPRVIVTPQPGPGAYAPQAQPAPATGMVIKASMATNPRAYREDAASHIYSLNRERIWKGRLPPLLYAVGVLQVEVDGRGNVRNLS